MERTIRVLPAGEGETKLIRGTGPLWTNLPNASVLGAAASGVPEELARVNADGGCAIMWSGSYAQVGGGELFEDDPRTWGPKGWSLLESRLHSWGDLCANLIVRTHARHVVGDVPGCKRFLNGELYRGLGVRLLIDPAATVTQDMLDRKMAEDHIRRMFEQLADMLDGGIGLDLLAGVVVAAPSGAGSVPLARGHPGCAQVVTECVPMVPMGTDLIVLDPADAQCAGGAGA